MSNPVVINLHIGKLIEKVDITVPSGEVHVEAAHSETQRELVKQVVTEIQRRLITTLAELSTSTGWLDNDLQKEPR